MHWLKLFSTFLPGNNDQTGKALKLCYHSENEKVLILFENKVMIYAMNEIRNENIVTIL